MNEKHTWLFQSTQKNNNEHQPGTDPLKTEQKTRTSSPSGQMMGWDDLTKSQIHCLMTWENKTKQQQKELEHVSEIARREN